MVAIFSVMLVLGLAAAAVSAIMFIVQKLRKREAKRMGIVLIAAIAVFIIGNIGMAMTYTPKEHPEEPVAEVTPTQTTEATQEPTQTTTPETTPEATQEPAVETKTPEEAQEPTETAEARKEPLFPIQEHPVMNGPQTERIGTWASITTTKAEAREAGDKAIHDFLDAEVDANGYNWLNVFFEDGTGLYYMPGMAGYFIQYGQIDPEEGGAIEYATDEEAAAGTYYFTDGTYKTADR